MLQRVPGIWLPPHRKELDYFDRYFHKGPSWYAEHFAAAPEGVLLGEATPAYLFDAHPARFNTVPGLDRFIAVLRDPVDRTISNYYWRRLLDNYKGSLEQFIEEVPEGLEHSRYATYLEAFYACHPREALHLCTFEDLKQDPATVLAGCVTHIGLSAALPDAQPSSPELDAVNSARESRVPGLYSLGSRASRAFRRHGFDRLPNALLALGMRRALTRPLPPELQDPTRTAEERSIVTSALADDLARLAVLHPELPAAWFDGR
jgi:hypothetical protein